MKNQRDHVPGNKHISRLKRQGIILLTANIQNIMIKATKLLTAVLTIILMSSFTNKNASDFIGTYGVSSSDPAQITLTINADHTFYYQDFSIADKKIAVEGNWKLKGQKVILQDNNSGIKFHNVWSFDENGQVAKSRKGLNFYRLCKI